MKEIKGDALVFLAILMTLGCLAQKKKNLLFIMTDQQQYKALSIAGNRVLETPNLDRLAKDGAYFKNAYTPMAVCGPARSAILTGKTVESTGVNTNDKTYFYDDEPVMTSLTFDEILSQNGCTTVREITIYVEVNWSVFIPNVFSPNSDGINDGLTVFTSASVKEVISLDIYDRWGEIVFRGGPFAPNEPTKGWDGNLNDEPMNPGVYVYVAQVRLLNDEVHSVSGNVTLVQ